MRTAETSATQAKLKAQMLENNLFEIKDRILEITRKLDRGKTP